MGIRLYVKLFQHYSQKIKKCIRLKKCKGFKKKKKRLEPGKSLNSKVRYAS